tara:strand:+ start:834 stop:1130 length:297 start_codon:yes stop_codon:yes gene_type:complete
MRIIKKELRKIIRESLEQVDWDNPVPDESDIDDKNRFSSQNFDGETSSAENEFEKAFYGLFATYQDELLSDRPDTDDDAAWNYSADKILALVNDLLGN